MSIRLAATVAIEIAHSGTDGRMHGHSLAVEVWTSAAICLDAWRAEVAAALEPVDGGVLEDTISGRTFEALGAAVLAALPAARCVVVRLPSRGHVVEVCRGG